ncbi:hypothetical protein [Pontibacillus salipaludis]|uniref:Uncharacterized protein n=1 Tax=Pontibacillus salipaludis TaxID=1697394 RepID=A0ABQ1PWI9_9BACI|nr:hypothetical protein [Pontibacillus salipaludis]GGD05197.1 hypothetical protein GCM10011389_10880 [Pontibacillus salipaludis]
MRKHREEVTTYVLSPQELEQRRIGAKCDLEDRKQARDANYSFARIKRAKRKNG